MKREKNAELEELFKLGIPIYSYSKLSTFNFCEYNYYQGYVLKKRSDDGIYGILGGVLHDGLEEQYKLNKPIKEYEEVFANTLRDCKKRGIKFPDNPPTIEKSYVANISHFFANYNVMDIKMKTEQFVLLKIPKFEDAIEKKDFYYVQMFIDSIYPYFEEIDGVSTFTGVVVNDWKTSSKFDKKALVKASKQLLLYKIGLEREKNVEVKQLGWTMLKYITPCSYSAKGEVKRFAMQQRKDFVKNFYKAIVKALIKDGMDTMESELLVGKCVNHNSLEFLPENIRKMFWYEDCFLELPFDDESVKGALDWVTNTIDTIESKSKEECDYKPLNIEEESFFCNTLCGRKDCKYLVKYNNANRDIYKKKKDEKERISEVANPVSKFNLDSLFD